MLFRLLSLIFFSAASTVAVPHTDEPLTENDVLWRGFADFPGHVFTGTIQDVIWQMKQIKGHDYTPDFMVEFNASAVQENINKAVKANIGKNIDNEQNVTITCEGESATAYRIVEGINYLKALPDDVTCQNGPGPDNCGRISCSWSSGITWCNQRVAPSDAFRCNQFAVPAQDILDTCLVMNDILRSLPTVAGYEYNDELGFKVIVAKSDC